MAADAAQQPGSAPGTGAQSTVGSAPNNQAAPGAAAETSTSAGGLDEIVVTAQRRTENLQTVPLSVVAIGAEQLKTQGVRTIEQLNRIAPNAVIERVGLFPGAAALSMRGIGYTGIESFTDPDVSVYVNGIYNARNSTALSQTIDVSSIEVLRGPQGTLFGRNAYAGTVSIQTNRPVMNGTTGSATATIGNLGLRDFDFIGNLPVVDEKIAGRIAIRSHNLGGLWRNNGITTGVNGPIDPNIAGDRIGKEESLVVRASLRFKPTERLDIQLIGEFLREKDQGAPIASVPLITGSSIATTLGGYQHNPFGDKKAGIPDDGTDPYSTGYSPGVGPMKFHTDSYTLDAGYETDVGTIRFLGNYQKTRSEVWVDTDGSVPNIFTTQRHERYRAMSGELQFVSDFSDRFDLIAGAFAFKDKYQTSQAGFTALAPGSSPPVFTQANYLNPRPGETTLTCGANLNPATGRYVVTTAGCTFPGFGIGYANNGGRRVAYAGYAQGEFHVTEALGIVAGVRYSYEKKYDYYGSNIALGATGLGRLYDFSTFQRPLDPALIFRAAPYKDDNWSPRIGVNYKLSPDIFLFGFWQRAFKSGGFNANASDLTAFLVPYGSQKVDNYEGGIKSEFFDRRLRVNIQGFYAKYKDLQRSVVIPSATAPIGVVTVVSNTSDITSYGVEAELAAKPVDQLTFFANIGWNKAKYTRYCADLNGPEAAANPTGIAPGLGICGPVTVVPGNLRLVPQDYSRNRPQRAPMWDITAGVTKEFTIGQGTLSASGSMNYRSSMYVDLLNRPYSYRPAMTTFDASLRWGPDDGRYSITAWGRNLTNRIEILSYTAVAPIFAFASPTPPRQYGVSASLNF